MLIEMAHTGSRTLHSDAAASISPPDNEHKTPSERAQLREVLSELRTLLEEYSPAWYTEEHHRRVESALHARKKH